MYCNMIFSFFDVPDPGMAAKALKAPLLSAWSMEAQEKA
jgi:hypothetical protein